MHDSYTVKEIATALGVDVSTVHRQAGNESWPVAGTRPGRGGGKLFALDDLPADVRVALSIQQSKAVATQCVAPTLQPAREARLTAVSDKKRQAGYAKADLVRIYVQTMQQAPWGAKDEARCQFMASYNSGAWPHIFKQLGEIATFKTIEKWKKALERKSGPDVLVDRRGLQQRQHTVLTEEHQRILVGCALHPNRPSIAAVIRRAQASFKAQGMTPEPSDRTMRRFLKHWKSLHYSQWIYMREGEKAWNDKCAFYIERDYDLIEVGDILVADGHKLNFEVLDWETGKPARMELVLWYDMASSYPLGWEILPSESTQSIAAAFRRAIIRLGAYPKIAYLDNGRAFKSNYFVGIDLAETGISGLFQSLGVQTIFAWPYHGQSKTIERFFGTFADLERWVPSYIGTSIEKKPPRLHRNEKLHKRLYAAAGGRPLTIEEAHTAIALWFDEYAKRPQKGHLNGRCPEEVFLAGHGSGVDVKELDNLMLATDRRVIHRNGVQFLGNNYYDPELYGRRHPVIIRYDLQDLERVRVYRENGAFICEAKKVRKVHPAAHILGNRGDQDQLEEAIRHKREQRQEASQTARQFLEAVVIPETQERMARITSKQQEVESAKPISLPELPEQTEARVAEIKAEHLRRKAEAPAYLPPEKNRNITTSLKKFEYLFQIRERDGITLREQDQDWMERYEQTDEFQRATNGGQRYTRLRELYQSQRANASNG